MSYVEEFCRDIAIIDKGNIALAGNLKTLRDSMARISWLYQMLIGELDELSQIIKDNNV